MSELQIKVEPLEGRISPVQQLLKETLHWATDSIPSTVESCAILSHVASRDRLPIDYASLTENLIPATSIETVENQFAHVREYFSAQNVQLTDQEEQAIQTGGFQVPHGMPVSEDLMHLSGDVNKSLYPINRSQARMAMDSAFILKDRATYSTPEAVEKVQGYYARLSDYLSETTNHTREIQRVAYMVKKAEDMNIDVNPIADQLREVRHILMERNSALGVSQDPFLNAGVRVPAEQANIWRDQMDRRMWEPENIVLFSNFSPKLWPDKYPSTPYEMNALFFRTRAEEVLNAKLIELKKTLPEKKYPTLDFSLMTDHKATFQDQKDFFDATLKADDSAKKRMAEEVFDTTYDKLEEFARNFHEDKRETQSGFTFISVDVNAFVEMNQITQDEYMNTLRFGGIKDALATLEPDMENLAKAHGGIWIQVHDEPEPLSDIKETFREMGASENDQVLVAGLRGRVYFHSFAGESEQPKFSKN